MHIEVSYETVKKQKACQ